MKQRLIVMNGQRLVQSERGQEWRIDKVDKADGLEPFIYNLYLALPADKSQTYIGVVLHTDKQFVYQFVKKGFVRHDAADFNMRLAHGMRVRILYKKGKAVISVMARK